MTVKSSTKINYSVYSDASGTAGIGVALASVAQNFAKNLARIIKERGMSQKDVAHSVGVGNSLVSHWIAGTHFARPAHLDGLATVLKCSYEDFVRDPEIPLQLSEIPEPSLKIDDLLEQLADRAGYKLVPKKRV